VDDLCEGCEEGRGYALKGPCQENKLIHYKKCFDNTGGVATDIW